MYFLPSIPPHHATSLFHWHLGWISNNNIKRSFNILKHIAPLPYNALDTV